MGLQSHFQWFTQLDEKLNINRYLKIWTISPDAKPILYVAKGHLFSKAHFIW
jgi:hypothetical protein